MAKRKRKPKIKKIVDRKAAGRKASRTRKLHSKGIDLQRKWEGKNAEGKPNGYHYERYNLPIIDPLTIGAIIKHVKGHTKRPFIVGGQIDFRDDDERIFTNNTPSYLPNEPDLASTIAQEIQHGIVHKSNPFHSGRSEKSDVEQTYILIRFARKLAKRRR